MHLFYATNIEKQDIILDAEESRHLAKVLRLNDGEIVHVIDGKGIRFKCTIISANPKKALLKIDSKEEINEFFGLSIAAAPTKNLNRWEWFLEKSTEIGIDAIFPINTYHSERKVLKRERQERILISAMKQSYKATLPTLSEIEKFDKLIKQKFEGQKFIAHCYENIPKEALKSVFNKRENALILIGPEGDFSELEVNKAIGVGFIPISLGQSRLRTETAALIACHSIHLLNE
jgi:16S rRNA (uracil1498-N3)-methyltransferase